MILHVDTSDINNILLNHKNELGTGAFWDSAGLIVSGLFDIYSVVTTDFNEIVKGILVALGIALILRGITSIYGCKKHPFTPETLLEEIEEKNRIEVQSALVALIDADCTDNRRILVYHDDGWDCDFLPNHRISDGSADSIERIALSKSLNNNFGFDIKPEELTFVSEKDSQKKSTEHDGELRYYHYRLYTVNWHDINDEWRKATFMARNGRKCRWVTIDEMYADRRMREVNLDVLSLLKSKLQ